MLSRYLIFLNTYYKSVIGHLSALYKDFLCCSDYNDTNPDVSFPKSSSELLSGDTQKNEIPVFLINARSVCNKMPLLHSYVREYCPLIICVTESWGHSDINDSFFALPNYSLYRCDRHNGVGGGVLIYVSHFFTSDLVMKFSEDHAESVSCRINVISNSTSYNLVVCCAYRPPSYPLQDSQFLAHLSDIVTRPCDFLVLCGDFNCPDVKWSEISLANRNCSMVS